MKLRSKLLLAAVSLLTVSVAATATSAYAWYAANRQVKASLSDVSVRSTETNIAVSLVKDPGEEAQDTKSPGFTHSGDGTGTSKGNSYSISTTQKVSDVSGIGNGSFVKPYIDATGEEIVGWHQDTSSNYYKFTLKFSATGGDKAVKLYFSGNSTITTGDGNSADLSLPNAARLSAVVGSEQKFVMIPSNETEHTYTDGKNGDASSSSYTGAITGLNDKKAADKLVFKQGTDDLTSNPTDTNTCHGLLGTVTPEIGESPAADLTVTFYLWVEGTVTELGNNNTTATCALASNLEFYTI